MICSSVYWSPSISILNINILIIENKNYQNTKIFRFHLFITAPPLSNACNVCEWPCVAAKCAVVWPLWSLTLILTPLCIKALISFYLAFINKSINRVKISLLVSMHIGRELLRYELLSSLLVLTLLYLHLSIVTNGDTLL